MAYGWQISDINHVGIDSNGNPYVNLETYGRPPPTREELEAILRAKEFLAYLNSRGPKHSGVFLSPENSHAIIQMDRQIYWSDLAISPEDKGKASGEECIVTMGMTDYPGDCLELNQENQARHRDNIKLISEGLERFLHAQGGQPKC